MFIFVLILLHVCNTVVSQRTYPCNQDSAYANYMGCLNQWRVVKEYSRGHSHFLKDVTLIDEICILPGHLRVKDMDKCVMLAVPQSCQSIIAHWTGMKKFVSFLCDRREAFEGKYARCRTDVGFQSAYESCMSTNVQQINTGEDNCWSYRELGTCLNNALDTHCCRKAAEFFSLAFSARDDPLVASTCKQEEQVPDYVFGIQVDSSSGNNQHKREKRPTDNSPNDSHMADVGEISFTVYESNNSCIVCASPYFILFFILVKTTF